LPTFDLGELGWSADLAHMLSPGLVPGRVIAAHRGAYDVQTAAGAVRTRLPGRLVSRFDVAVGDWVGLGCDALRRRVEPECTAVLLGASGVGKSTLVNRFAGRELMATRETRAEDDEGRLVTTRRELVLLPGGGLLIDTPGLRELQLWDGAAALDAAFADVEALAGGCRFGDCGHTREPGCAVLVAVDAGELGLERLRSWRKLERELRWSEVRQDAQLRCEESRRWGRITREGKRRARRR
jgi:ribosome biogenesis GTPase